MAASRDGLASVSLGTTEEIGLHRLAEDARVVDHLVSLAEEGLASGLDDHFDIDTFVEEARPREQFVGWMQTHHSPSTQGVREADRATG